MISPSQHCAAQRCDLLVSMISHRSLTLCVAERLRRLELYGVDKHHPSEAPHRDIAQTLVFHMADVDTVDASYVPLMTFHFRLSDIPDSAVQIFHELLETYQVRSSISLQSCLADSHLIAPWRATVYHASQTQRTRVFLSSRHS